MTLIIKDDILIYNDLILLDYDDWDGVIVHWDNVQLTLDALGLDILFEFDLLGKYKLVEGKEEALALKSFCLALMFARNYGFRSNIDLTIYEKVWENYRINASKNNKGEIFESELLITNDIDSVELTMYEDSQVVNDRRYTLYATVDWKNTLSCLKGFIEGYKDLDSEILMALGLAEARVIGLTEGSLR